MTSFYLTPLGEEMATHSRILAWRIPWTEEAGGLQSMGSQRVRHNLVTKRATNKNPRKGKLGVVHEYVLSMAQEFVLWSRLEYHRVTSPLVLP